MKILLTGASSFTGYWIAKTLSNAGHEVIAPLLRSRECYHGDLRGERVAELDGMIRVVPNCSFGNSNFMALLDEGFDLLSHHAAQVGDYRSADFDICGAVAANTHNLRAILRSGKVGTMLLTSTIFAPGEGVGTPPLSAFSAYGLSKGLTKDIVTYCAAESDVVLGRFVIPNPFGPLEEPRFCAYLMRTWKTGKVATVNTPAYVRDNIHLDLMAASYRRYAEQIVSGTAQAAMYPSGYVESQGVFAERFAHEMRTRSSLECTLNLLPQTEFSEPFMRVNTDPARAMAPEWEEPKAWDAIAEYYL